MFSDNAVSQTDTGAGGKNKHNHLEHSHTRCGIAARSVKL